MQISAALLHSLDSPFTVEKLKLREPRADEVLVRIVGAGMCHTDLVTRMAPAELVPLPIVLGHEGAGIIEHVGPHVTQFSVGDHVVLTFDSCGWCGQCLTGTPSYCDEFAMRNIVGMRGGELTQGVDEKGTPALAGFFGQSSFASHSLATQRNIVKVDKDLPLAMLGPLGCGLQTGAGAILNSMDVRFDASVAVFGTGAVGLSAVMAAHIAGATKIIAVDINPARRALASELGATHTLDGADPEVAAQIKSITSGGVTHALDTTGVPSVILTALGALRPRGFCGLVGAGSAPVELLPPYALGEGRKLSFIMEGDAIPQLLIPKLIEFWQAGRFPFDRLITTYALDDINVAEADCKSGDAVKPVLIPGQ